MDFTGRFNTVGKDFLTGKYIVDLRVNEDAFRTFERLRDKDIDISIKQHREKRSLDANAYMWVLLQKMAEVIHSTKDDLYIEELSKHGQFTHIVVKPHVVDKVKEQWRTVRELGEISVNGQSGIQLQCFFGSSTYDTKEMSKLIDGIIGDAKELGIETLPPIEIARMKEQWRVEP